MSKLRLSLLILVVAGLATSVSFGQLFSFEPGGATAKQKPSSGPVKVLSPEEFKSSVGTMSQQNQQQFNQKSSSFIKEQISALPSKNAAPSPLQNAPQAVAPVKPKPSTSSSDTGVIPPVPDATPPASSSQATPVSSPPAMANLPPAPTAAPSSPPPAPASAPYTGFGGGGSSTTAPTTAPASGGSSSGTSGGWNVKY